MRERKRGGGGEREREGEGGEGEGGEKSKIIDTGNADASHGSPYSI